MASKATTAPKQKEAKDSPSKVVLNAEIFGLGRKIRHLQPPGGKESGAFDAYKRSMENIAMDKKANDFMKSRVFDNSSPSPDNMNDGILDLGIKLKHLQPPGGTESGIFDEQLLENISIQKKVNDNWKSNIFEVFSSSLADNIAANSQRLRNKYKSTVFEPDPPIKPVKYEIDPHNPVTGKDVEKERPKKYEVRNPITSEGIQDNFKPLRKKKFFSRSSGFVLEYNEMPTPF